MQDISAEVKQFYERFPYPSRSHIGRKELEKYLKWVLPVFGENNLSFFSGKKILDLGCGTGEFSTALALQGAKVTGIDLSLTSVEKARFFAQKMTAKDISFLQENLFNFSSKEKFDIVFSLGVLHHTSSARKAFGRAVSFCKKDGFVCIGLYNRFGRARQGFRRLLLSVLAGKDIEKRMELAKKIFPDERAKDTAWLADKYGQLHESAHSIPEVLSWFNENRLEFQGCRPEFDRKKSSLIQQLKWLFEEKGAFFVVAGKKN